jgi:hypothetical protein
MCIVASKRHSVSHKCVFVHYQYDETRKHFFLQPAERHHLVYCTVHYPVADGRTGLGALFLSHSLPLWWKGDLSRSIGWLQ